MNATGVKTVGYIGYNDAWGDLVYDALKKTAEPAGMQIVDQRALRACRHFGDRAGLQHRRGSAGSGDDGRLGHARRAAVHRARRTWLQGPDLRHPCADQSGFHARRRERGRRRDLPDRACRGGRAASGIAPDPQDRARIRAAYQKANNEPARGAFAPTRSTLADHARCGKRASQPARNPVRRNSAPRCAMPSSPQGSGRHACGLQFHARRPPPAWTIARACW